MSVGDTVCDLTGVKGKIVAIDGAKALVQWLHHERETWIKLSFLEAID